jgi:hypothetical protein
LKGAGICVSLLHPGFNKTDMTKKYEHIWEVTGRITTIVVVVVVVVVVLVGGGGLVVVIHSISGGSSSTF